MHPYTSCLSWSAFVSTLKGVMIRTNACKTEFLVLTGGDASVLHATRNCVVGMLMQQPRVTHACYAHVHMCMDHHIVL